MATRFNRIALPFSIRFDGTLNYFSIVTEVWKNRQGEDTSLASFGESAPVAVSFYVENEAEYDSEAYIRIETSLFDENEQQINLEFPLVLNHVDTQDPVQRWMYESNRNKEYPWRLGRYGIEIFYKGEKYVYLPKIPTLQFTVLNTI
jgi:hypothetical protein